MSMRNIKEHLMRKTKVEYKENGRNDQYAEIYQMKKVYKSRIIILMCIRKKNDSLFKFPSKTSMNGIKCHLILNDIFSF